MKRVDAMRALLRAMSDRVAVCYAGAACEELYAAGDDARVVYVLGSMGLASSVGLGMALGSGKPVVAMEGDASVLMNLGTLVTIAQHAPSDYVLAIVDNTQNGSTGGQPTATANGLDLAALARAAGCPRVIVCTTEDEIAAAAREAASGGGPTVLHLRVAPGDGPRRVVDLDPTAIRDRARSYLAAR
ncbi:MAG: thiamine pyrophosphate-dependent enzyme [Chloroflexota bacterium]